MPERWDIAIQIVKRRLEADDPQLPGCDIRAERIISDLYEQGFLSTTRRIDRVEITQGVL